MFRSFIAKTRPSRGSLLRSGDRSFRVSRSSPSVSSSKSPPPAEKFKYQAESSGKQNINLADDFHRKVMGNFMFGGFALVAVTFYYVKGYVLMNNANQDYLKMVGFAGDQADRAAAGGQADRAPAGGQADRAAAG